MNDHPVAFITGASRGIGRSIALELAKQGFDVAGNALHFEQHNKQKGLFEVKERIAELGAVFLPIEGDVSSIQDHETMLKLILHEFGRIDLLVNNAGVAPEPRLDILEAKPESFDRVLSINMRGPFFLTQAVAKQMVKQTRTGTPIRPQIIFITSISAELSSPSRAEYCISKAALSHTARIYADRLAEFGINVYEIRPGIIRTDMTTSEQTRYDKLIAEGLVPQKRWGTPQDVGKVVAAIAQGDLAYCTGMVFEVSGGLHIRRL